MEKNKRNELLFFFEFGGERGMGRMKGGNSTHSYIAHWGVVNR